MPASLVLRADGGVRSGGGHVMRCLALAQEWARRGGRPTFVLAEGADALGDRIRREGAELIRLEAEPGSRDDALGTAAAAAAAGAAWIVLDGYHFGEAYQHALRDGGARLLVLDDAGGSGRWVADLLLNQNLHADEAMYDAREPHTRLLLGPRFVLLRREFLDRGATPRGATGRAPKVLVTLGGSDSGNHSLSVLRALRSAAPEGAEVTVVVGPMNPHGESLRREAAACPFPARVLSRVGDLPALMAEADAAVATAGTTVWELAFLGLPAIVGVSSSVEERFADGLRRHGLFATLGWFDRRSDHELAEAIGAFLRDREGRAAMAERIRGVVDGRGAERVADLLREGTA